MVVGFHIPSEVAALENGSVLWEMHEKVVNYLIPTYILGLLISCLGAVGNITVLYVYHFHLRKSSVRCFVRWLAVYDFLMSVVVSAVNIKHMFYFWIDTDVLACRVFRTIHSSVLFGNVYILMAVAVHSYVKICHPFHHVNPRNVQIACAMSLCVTLPCNIPFAFTTFGISRGSTLVSGIRGYICFYDEASKNSTMTIVYSAILRVYFTLVFLTFIVCYTLILRKMRRQKGKNIGHVISEHKRQRLMATARVIQHLSIASISRGRVTPENTEPSIGNPTPPASSYYPSIDSPESRDSPSHRHHSAIMPVSTPGVKTSNNAYLMPSSSDWHGGGEAGGGAGGGRGKGAKGVGGGRGASLTRSLWLFLQNNIKSFTTPKQEKGANVHQTTTHTPNPLFAPDLPQDGSGSLCKMTLGITPEDTSDTACHTPQHCLSATMIEENISPSESPSHSIFDATGVQDESGPNGQESSKRSEAKSPKKKNSKHGQDKPPKPGGNKLPKLDDNNSSKPEKTENSPEPDGGGGPVCSVHWTSSIQSSTDNVTEQSEAQTPKISVVNTCPEADEEEGKVPTSYGGNGGKKAVGSPQLGLSERRTLVIDNIHIQTSQAYEPSSSFAVLGSETWTTAGTECDIDHHHPHHRLHPQEPHPHRHHHDSLQQPHHLKGHHHRHRHSIHKKKKMLCFWDHTSVSMFVVCMSFIVSYLPSTIVTSLIGEITETTNYVRTGLYIFVLQCTYIQNVTHPVVYFVFNRKFHDEVVKLCVGIKRRLARALSLDLSQRLW